MPNAAIEIHGLTKSYGSFTALAGIDLRVERGEVFAIIGPNGAGKTTMVEILEGYRRRDGGEVRVLGFDPGSQRCSLKPHIGIVLQATGVEAYLTVAETITMYAGYYPHPRPVGEIMELVGLAEKRNVRVARLSGGQQRRLDVAVALAGDPDLLFLDEPTTGFDPAARREFWDVIKNLAALGKTVLLTTHYLDEAQHLADRLAVVAQGRIVAEGTPSTLGGRAGARAILSYRAAGDHELPPGYTRDGDLARMFHESGGGDRVDGAVVV
jgi:ABC-2 type transport system ATP-binding protein